MTAFPNPPVLSPLDLARLENEAGVEYINGQIVEKPVSLESIRIESRINRLLGNEAEKTGVAQVYTSSMGYKCFADDPMRFRKPDVSLVRAPRLVGLSPLEGFIHFAPDLAVEVLSPTDRAYELAENVEDYLSNGFPLVWVVHPNTRCVVVYRPDGSAKILHENDEISGEGALPSFRCTVAELLGKST